MKILITGGLGYIGSNIVLQLLKKKNEIIVLDNLSNSSKVVINNINKLCKKKFIFIKVDCKNQKKIYYIFNKYKPDLVIHLAGVKSVTESLKYPKFYYKENVTSSFVILSAMKKYNINKIIFSSSATVYGKPKYLPLDEKHPLNPETPYGHNKLTIENKINQICKLKKDWSAICLRYFNPVGTDNSGLLKDNPLKPTNLFPKINHYFLGKTKFLPIYGKNYKTKDGTAVRDYIHILDLVASHNASIKYLQKKKGFIVFNVGTGKGLSVLKIVKTYEKINKIKIETIIKKRRPGDVSTVYASVKKIKNFIGWRSKYKINHMCEIKNK